ncbi:unnamed protein product [Rotaria sp. Silwood1]|nr:unnamed protein product [Rotaria sp. Silwood1]CAF1144513.1 unnamed protein product [Rotaria sp. Silwood1]CAF3429725.1 unnamed protein product [Rotaria sp. Silwood1]CAF3468105.1 unnamed protein product [Rotaria sp. Silwood1]CAF3475621.1 unnamed protein product [Rotaria sp. Silwood1]
MYFFELFSHADRFPYRTYLFSSATYVFISFTALTLLPPFLLTYYTGDFWIKESIYSEQPRIHNQTKYILIAENNDATNNQFFLSSYSTLNRNFQESLIPGNTIESLYDVDGDGLMDQFRISFDLIFAQSNTVIRSINIWLIFQYELREKQRINMETMALINIVPPSILTSNSNANLTIYGQLIFNQRQAIKSSGNDSIYDKSIIDTSSSSILDLNSILREYFARKYYTSYQTQYTWTTPRTTTTSTSNILTVNVLVNIGRQSIRFTPGFWQDFKWGWIQYICVLVPFIMVFNRLKLFVFSNNLVRTLAPPSYHPHQM